MTLILLLALCNLQLPVPSETRPPLAGSPAAAGNYKEVTEAQAADAIAQEKRDKMTLPELERAYERFLTELIPDYNNIKVKAGRHHYHNCLMGLHPFFNKYSFSVGPLAKHVSNWIVQHETALRAAKIKEVGVAEYWHISPENDAAFDLSKWRK